jgi:hypothetical protein
MKENREKKLTMRKCKIKDNSKTLLSLSPFITTFMA